MVKEAWQVESELRTGFDTLNRDAPEIATDLLSMFREQTGDSRLRNPADAPAKWHSGFLGTVESFASDMDCTGDW